LRELITGGDDVMNEAAAVDENNNGVTPQPLNEKTFYL